MSNGLPTSGGVSVEELPEKMDKSLQKENKRLKGDIKQMEMKIKAMQVECTKSFQMKERLEGLCRELQKQNKYIKAESSSKIQEANARGKELASEVQNNMGFMKSINENLAAISSESLTVKRENEELAKKIAILKGHYEEREQILQEALKETNDSLQKAKIDLGETKLKGAEEKQQLIGEMQKLADSLVQSREQLKDAKQTEVSLKGMIQNYEDKFNGLQKSLMDTNGSYEEFRSEMNKVSSRTKELEKETFKWQKRWEESNVSLQKMRENYARVQDDLQKSQENLDKMKTLCRTLHTENRDLLLELKGQVVEKQNGEESASGHESGSESSASGVTGLTASAVATLASINTEVEIEKLAALPKVKVEENQVPKKPNENELGSPKKDKKIDDDSNNLSSPVNKGSKNEDKSPSQSEIDVAATPSPAIDANGNAPAQPVLPSNPTTPEKITEQKETSTSNKETASPTPPPPKILEQPPTAGPTTPGDTSDSGSKGKKNKNKKKNKK